MKKYQTFPVEYDFKRAQLDLIDQNTGKIKDKYKCLLMMVTLPLSSILGSLGNLIEPLPQYIQTILKSTTNNNGWLNFIPIENIQPNIIIIQSNYLYFSNLSYNYDITVDIVKKGKDNVDLRFMSENSTSRLASNINDLNLNEIMFSNLSNNDQFKFTVIGGYEFFYINYPTTDFDINITVNISTAKTPNYISDHKCKKCTCFDIEGNGYVRLKNKKGECIFVPVYTSRTYGNTVTKYLYPEFNYLRDVFYNITLANSLPPPTLPTQKLQINQPRTIIKEITVIPDYSYIIRCSIVGHDQCVPVFWCSYVTFRHGDILTLINSRDYLCFTLDVIEQNKDIYVHYKYSWDKTKTILISNEKDDRLIFTLYHRPPYGLGGWSEINDKYRITALRTEINGRYEHYLPTGSIVNYSPHKTIAFGFIWVPQSGDSFDTETGPGVIDFKNDYGFNISVGLLG